MIASAAISNSKQLINRESSEASYSRAKINRMALDLASAGATRLHAHCTAGTRAGSPLSRSTYCGGLAPFRAPVACPGATGDAPVPLPARGQAPPQTAEPVPSAPRARLATRLPGTPCSEGMQGVDVTNRHEYSGLACL